jgi:hypothetical protein
MLEQEQRYQGYEDLPGNDLEEMIETRYLYIYDGDPEKPRWNKDQITAAIMGFLALAMIVGACFIPTGQSYSIQTISVPAIFHPVELKASADIMPTGIQNYPASRAKGVLTVYNASFLTQFLQAGFILSTHDGIEVMTDETVTIPANNPPYNGIAHVSAHAVIPGSQGNIQVGAINTVYGSSLYLKNLAAFSGGQDAYTKTFVTANDKATAVTAARAQLDAKTPIGLQRKPCTDTPSQAALNLTVTRLCEYITYQSPSNGQILAVRVQGDKVFLTVKVLAHVVTSHFVK